LIPKADPLPRQRRDGAGARVGADVGATLAKLAIRHGNGAGELRLFPSTALPALADRIAAVEPARIGLTGGGAARLADLLGVESPPASEFDAWAAGARAMLRESDVPPPERFLLVSVGTGTSAMLVSSAGSVRVGGTALGGGTVTGLAAALIGAADFDVIRRLASEGDRRRVDLLVRDIYPNGDTPLPGDLNAASFARLAREPRDGEPAACDLAHAIMGLVGENVALICGGLAAAAGVQQIVYGGTTLHGNTAITDLLVALAPVGGCRATILADGEFTGARGALELATKEGS
jgi:type II pantothenate kinase